MLKFKLREAKKASLYPFPPVMVLANEKEPKPRQAVIGETAGDVRRGQVFASVEALEGLQPAQTCL